MINQVVSAISVALYNCFGADYKIYKEAIQQGLHQPCFLITVLEPSRTEYIDTRSLCNNQVSIQYFPKTKNTKQEFNNVINLLFNCLELVTLSNGDLIRGTDMSATTTEDVLTFVVNYDFFVHTTTIIDNNMDEINILSTAKGD